MVTKWYASAFGAWKLNWKRDGLRHLYFKINIFGAMYLSQKCLLGIRGHLLPHHHFIYANKSITTRKFAALC
jgi:hypothetical protein